MERDNFYILLELPFDPPAHDTAEIKAAIHAKRQEWIRLQDIPESRGEALRCLEQMPELEKTMFNQRLRDLEAQGAQRLRTEKMKQFEAELRILEGKGYLLPRELAAVSKKYRAYGIDREMIRKNIQAPVTDVAPKQKAPEQTHALARTEVENIVKNLKVLGLATLYDFLEQPADASAQVLFDAARQKHRDAFQSSTRDAKTSAAQMLAEISLVLFESTEKREQYDLYLTVSTYPALNDLINEEAERSQHVSSEVMVRLVNFGVSTYGAKVLDVEDYIRRYCSAYDIPVHSMSKQFPCPACHNVTNADALICSTCAAPLKGDCPTCGTPFSGGAALCSECGFQLSDMVKALGYLQQTKDSLIEGTLSTAQRALEYADKYWPNHPNSAQLHERIQKLEDRYMGYMQSIDDSVQQGRYYTALALVEEARSHQIHIPTTTTNQIEKTLAEFEEKIQSLRQAGQASFDTLTEMLAFVTDSVDLDRMLAQYPPDPPPRITAKEIEGKVLINWNASPSSGTIRYVVVRKEHSVPLTAYDGEVLYEGGENAYTDDTVPPLRHYYYSVFSKRGNRYSDIGAVAPAAIRIVPELGGVRIVPADQAAQLSWIPAPELRSVKIWRKLGGDPPTSTTEGKELACDRLDGYTDMKLKNDVEYWYYLVAVYAVGDETVESRGIVESVVPQTLIAPIDNLTVIQVEDQASKNTFVANWEGTPHAEILLLACAEKPSYYSGQMVPVSDLLANNSRMILARQTADSARFTYDFSGGTYLFPAIVSGRYASVGSPVYLTNVPNVEKVSHQFVGDDLFLHFDWPEDLPVSKVCITWRKKEYPNAPEQDGTSAVVYSRAQYLTENGVYFADIDPDCYFFRIFSLFDAPDGTTLRSIGADIIVDNTPQQEIFYEIKYSKPLFSSAYTVQLTIRANEEFFMSRAVLIGKEGQLPLHIEDGEALFEVERDQKVPGSLTYEYKTTKLSKNLFIRMFFYDKAAYHKLRPLPAKDFMLG